MGEYRVNLDVFAGPLDLLLYLIRKEEVDIYDISITNITDQYLKYIEMLKSLDINIAGDFLVMASTLMQIKSAMLLPKEDTDQDDQQDISDPRAELIRQLFEYKKFKDAANLLNIAADEKQKRFSRPNTIIDELKPEVEPQIDMDQVSVWDLLEAFNSILEATGSTVDISHIKDDTPIDLYQVEILHRLQTEGSMSFEQVFGGKSNRLVMIGLFLALLELIRGKLVWVEQLKPSNSFYLKALTDEPAEKVVQNAIIAMSEADSECNAETQLKQQIPIAITEVTPKQKRHDLSSDDKQETEHIEGDKE